MRKCYIVNYDLRNSRDYNSLYNAIKSYGTYAHILDSCWAIVTTQNAQEVRDFLKQEIDSDDGLFVVKSGKEAAWININCTSQWLKDQL